MNRFEKISVNDQNSIYLDKLQEDLAETKKIAKVYNCGLQNLVPEEKYDLIWI